MTRTRRLEVRPLTEADLPAAGRLLAERHRTQRTVQPLLSTRFERADAAEAEVVAAWKAEGASGAIALRDGSPVGFLLGAPKQGTLWGPNVWVEQAGQATSDPEVMRDLYALAATRWVADGRTAQYVLVPATDRGLVDAWFRLGFGGQHTHAIRPVPTSTQVAVPAGLVVRPARREDVPVLARLDLELPSHQALAPTFSAGDMGDFDELVQEWQEDFDGGLVDFGVFVAEHEGEVIGSVVGCPVEKSGSHAGLARADNAGLLSFAAVFPAARGLGAGRALGETLLAWCAERGFASVITDWRTTNLLSSRAWPALGFEPTFLRLHRTIGY